MAPLSICGISKYYGSFAAVRNLHLEAAPGEILGFLGLNGAGKTTTLRILLDLLRPNTGQAFIFGHDCQKDGIEARKSVGYLPGELGIYVHLTGREVLDLLAGLDRRPPNLKYRHELQERLDLPDRDVQRRLREYSTGMKRKLGLIQAFQSDPPLLILDEPTEGLDPLMQEAFYELLADSKRRGKTVFMSSHVLSEVGRVCDRIALLRKGELALLCGVEESRKLAARRVRVVFAGKVNGEHVLPLGVEVVEKSPLVWNVKIEGPLGPLLTAISGLPVKDLEVAEPRLEDIVMQYYRDSAA
jgi:ABC-2 type transport system ATP-binding protein